MKNHIKPLPRGKSRDYICIYCGKTFVDDISAKRKYCSRDCYHKHSSELRKGITPKGKTPSLFVVCGTCGKKFRTYQHRLEDSRGKFCSKACYAEYQRESMQGRSFPWKVPSGEDHPSYKGKIRVECSNCGKSFEVYPHRIRDHENLFCSLSCSSSYLEKIPSNESQKHIKLKNACSTTLKILEWDVEIEKWVTVNGNHYKIDVYAEKDDQKLLVECGYCPKAKLKELKEKYDVFHFSYGATKQKQRKLKKYANACCSPSGNCNQFINQT